MDWGEIFGDQVIAGPFIRLLQPAQLSLSCCRAIPDFSEFQGVGL
ncbi:hypothetical protein [Litchfieldella anticariensis]